MSPRGNIGSLRGGRHSSVVLSAATILWPCWFESQTQHQCFFAIETVKIETVSAVGMRKGRIKLKRDRDWPISKNNDHLKLFSYVVVQPSTTAAATTTTVAAATTTTAAATTSASHEAMRKMALTRISFQWKDKNSKKFKNSSSWEVSDETEKAEIR